MNSREVRRIAELLPEASPYNAWITREEKGARNPRSQAARVWAASLDPAFRAHLAKSYAAAELPLPSFAADPLMIRAHGFWVAEGPPDLPLAYAEALSTPTAAAQSCLLKALLLCTDASTGRVAEACALEAEVVHLFENLFWNVLDRRSELYYLGTICGFTHTGGPGGASLSKLVPGWELLQTGLCERSMQRVLAVAEAARPSEELANSPDMTRSELRRRVLASAAEGLAMGAFSEADNPALKPALKMMANMKRRKLGTPAKPQTDVSGAMLTYLSIVRPHAGGSKEPGCPAPEETCDDSETNPGEGPLREGHDENGTL